MLGCTKNRFICGWARFFSAGPSWLFIYFVGLKQWVDGGPVCSTKTVCWSRWRIAFVANGQRTRRFRRFTCSKLPGASEKFTCINCCLNGIRTFLNTPIFLFVLMNVFCEWNFFFCLIWVFLHTCICNKPKSNNILLFVIERVFKINSHYQLSSENCDKKYVI